VELVRELGVISVIQSFLDIYQPTHVAKAEEQRGFHWSFIFPFFELLTSRHCVIQGPSLQCIL
jgi:hypothetical protein